MKLFKPNTVILIWSGLTLVDGIWASINRWHTGQWSKPLLILTLISAMTTALWIVLLNREEEDE